MKSLCITGLLFCMSCPVWAQHPVPGQSKQDLDYAGRSLSVWVSLLKDKDPKVRQRAAEAVGNIGSQSSDVVPRLIEALKDNSPAVRAEAAWALRRCPPLGQAQVRALLSALKDKEPCVRMWGAKALGKVQPVVDFPAAFNRSRDLIGDFVLETLRFTAIFVCDTDPLDMVGEVDPETARVIKALTGTLRDSDPRVRRCSADALGEIGNAARSAVPDLKRAIKDANPDVRDAVRSALKCMGPNGEIAIQEAQEVQLIAHLAPAEEDPVGNNRPLRAAALRMPFVYAMDREGTLYVFNAPQGVTDDEVRPVKVIRNAGDGRDLKVFGSYLLCTRWGRIEVYSLKVPASPQYLDLFGPDNLNFDSQTIVAAGRTAYLVGRDFILTYDLGDPASPRYIGITPGGQSGTGCMIGRYLCVGESELRKGDRQGIAVYDTSNPRALQEIGFVATSGTPYDLFALDGNRLLASLDGARFSIGQGINGNAELINLANPRQPASIARWTNAGGRATTLLTSGKKHYFVCAGGVYLIEDKSLNWFVPLPTSGLLADGRPYHGDSDGTYAVLALGGHVALMRTNPASK